jgi:outer membrane protein
MRAGRRDVLAGVVSALVSTGVAAQHQPAPAPAQPAQLQVSLAEAVRRALDVQPAMVRARGDATNAGWQKRGAFGAFLPTVTLSSTASRQNAPSVGGIGVEVQPGTYTYSSGLTASVDLFTGFRRLANYRNADATQDAADAEVVNQRYVVSAATAQFFYTSLANEELVHVAAAQLERAKEELQISVNKFQAGAATRSDTLTATVDLGNARLALLQAQANLATAQANLARQIGVDGVVRAVPDSQLPPVPDTTELRTAALRQAPVVMQAAASERATGATLWSSRSQYLPRLTASYNTSSQGLSEPWQGFDGGNRNLNRLSFALSWTLFDGFQRERTAAQSSVDLDVARAQTADTRRQLDANLTQQLAALFTAYTQISITQANVAAATEALRVQQERYRLGASTLLDLLTAQANMTQAEVNQVSARYNYLIARAQVEALVGHAL